MTGLHKLFIAALLFFGLLAGGLQIPVVMKQKDEAHDKQIVEDFERISAAVQTSSSDNNGKLPSSLAAVKTPSELKDRLKNYKYSLMVNGVSYQLCATFKTDASSSKKTYPASDMSYYGLGEPDVENHKLGEQCFTYTVSSGFDFDDYYDDSNESSSSLPSTFGNIQARADDSELQTDINSISSQLEGYFAMEGMYPTLTQLADSGWRASHEIRAGDSFTGPNGEKLGAGYTYTAGPVGCDGATKLCETYTLSVKLSDRTTYTKKSLD